MSWLPKFDPENQDALVKSFISAFVLSSVLYSSGALAQTTVSVGSITATIPDLGQMITNFATALPNLMRLLTAGSYVLSFLMITKAIVGMKHFGELRTMMQREHGMWGPIIELLVGCAMLYLPSSVHTVMNTFWQSPNPYAYVAADTASNSVLINTCYGIVQMLGVIAFIRGLLILQQAGSERAQPHMMGKAMSHLFGGVLCINIYGTIQTLEKTVGMIT